MAFRRVASSGYCCTVQLEEQGDGTLLEVATGRVLEDPDGLFVRLDCTEAQEQAQQCRRLPSDVIEMPGILTMPPGCDEALADAGMAGPEDNRALRLEDVGGDLVELWAAQCFLPPRDQDYDGVGDACDLCEFAYDPENTQYVDDFGKLWPKDGAFCNGAYLPDLLCEDEEPDFGTGTGTGGDGSGSGGSGSGGSGSGGSGSTGG